MTEGTRGPAGAGSSPTPEREDGDVVRRLALADEAPDGADEPGDGLGRRATRRGRQVGEKALVAEQSLSSIASTTPSV